MIKKTTNKTQKIQVWVSLEQKNQLKRMADLAQKSVSDYVRDAALNANIDSTKSGFYRGINSDILTLLTNQYITNRVLLEIGGVVIKDTDIMDIYDKAKAEAEKKIRED